MNRGLVWLGVACIVIGLGWPWIKSIPFGRLPGDISIVRENFRFHFPLTTCLVISILITLLLWLFRK